jgi:hypothetical protein
VPCHTVPPVVPVAPQQPAQGGVQVGGRRPVRRALRDKPLRGLATGRMHARACKLTSFWAFDRGDRPPNGSAVQGFTVWRPGTNCAATPWCLHREEEQPTYHFTGARWGLFGAHSLQLRRSAHLELRVGGAGLWCSVRQLSCANFSACMIVP